MSTVSKESVRYRPQPLIRAGSTVYLPEAAALAEFFYEPMTARLLSGWQRFETLETVLLRSVMGADVFDVGANRDRISLCALIARWLARRRIAALIMNPMLVHLRQRLEQLAADGVLVSAPALLEASRRRG